MTTETKTTNNGTKKHPTHETSTTHDNTTKQSTSKTKTTRDNPTKQSTNKTNTTNDDTTKQSTDTTNTTLTNNTTKQPKALVVEDVREACVALRAHNYDCDRITHAEVLSHTGESYFRDILEKNYDLLWISTPSDWHVRTPTKKTKTYWKRLQTWITKAVKRNIKTVVYGPPGYFWKIPNIEETIRDLQLGYDKIRLCHFGYFWLPIRQERTTKCYIHEICHKHTPQTSTMALFMQNTLRRTRQRLVRKK